MPPSRRDRLPRETVRDLLGITRALYRAELALPPPRADRLRIEQLEDIGKKLRLALELSAQTEPDTMGHRAAWSWAEQASQALGEFVGESMLMAPAIRAAAARLK
jgi:hypothetical protein